MTVGSVPQRFHRNRPARSSSIPALLEREDCTLVAWYRFLYAPRTGGAYDSHHGTAGIAGRTRRRRRCMASRGAGAAAGDASDRVPPQRVARRRHAPRGRVPPGPEGFVLAGYG